MKLLSIIVWVIIVFLPLGIRVLWAIYRTINRDDDTDIQPLPEEQQKARISWKLLIIYPILVIASTAWFVIQVIGLNYGPLSLRYMFVYTGSFLIAIGGIVLAFVLLKHNLKKKYPDLYDLPKDHKLDSKMELDLLNKQSDIFLKNIWWIIFIPFAVTILVAAYIFLVAFFSGNLAI